MSAIKWLTTHRLLAVLLATALYCSVVFYHDDITEQAMVFYYKVGETLYNVYMEYVFVGLLMPVLGVLGWLVFKSNHRVFFSLLTLANLLLIWASYRFLVTYNIEFVHYFAYMALAFVLLPVLRNLGDTVVVVTLLGALDEGYQYLILSPDFEYYDFNDVLLNLVGAGTGVLAALVLGRGRILLRTGPFYTSKAIWLALSVPVLFYLACQIGWAVVGPVENPGREMMFALFRKAQGDGFWKEPYTGKFFHVIRPAEGAILIYSLFIAYFLLNDQMGFVQAKDSRPR